MGNPRSLGRRRRETMIVLLVIVVAAALIGSKLSEGPSEFTTASTAHSRCGGSTVMIAATVRPTLEVRNTSGHDWTTSYISIDGASDLGPAGVSLGGRQSTSDGGGIYDVGPLAAGSSGEIRVYLIASARGRDTVRLRVWGSNSATNDPSPPSVAPGVTCTYTVRP